MKPEEIEEKFVKKRRELLRYSTLETNSSEAKLIKRKYKVIVDLEKNWGNIIYKLKKNKYSLDIIEEGILCNQEKLRTLLNSSDDNRKETDFLTDIILSLKRDKEKFRIKRDSLLEKNWKIYSDNLEIFHELGIEIDNETKAKFTETMLINNPVARVEALIEESSSDEEPLVVVSDRHEIISHEKEKENFEEQYLAQKI